MPDTPNSSAQDVRPMHDSDPHETAEWTEALQSVLRVAGPQRVD